MNTININGKTIVSDGKNINITNGKVIIDGVEVETDPDQKKIVINVTGDVDKIETDAGDVNVTGNVNSVASQSGDIEVHQDIKGSVATQSGDVEAHTIHGNVVTQSGDISSR